MDRKTYMKEVYWKYWITAREKKYGFLEYDKCLCDYICVHLSNGSRLLEVGVGTGYPFAAFFAAAGYSVWGVDISLPLIEKCQRLYPEVKCEVGDAENLGYRDEYFDVTYCFHSIWYFPDPTRAVDEMLRVTRNGGLVMFDILNRDNPTIRRGFQKHVLESKGVFRIVRCLKNIAKIILRRGTPDWHFVVHQVPTYPESIFEHLVARGIKTFEVLSPDDNGFLEVQGEHHFLVQCPRLIFVIRK